MSEMSYLEKLLDGVEVEWKAVGDIAGYSTTKVDADKLDATSFVGVDNLLADKGGRIDATYQPNTARLTAYEPGDILLGNIRPYLKKVWMAENNGGCSGDVLAIRILADCKKIISPEYLYYALSSDSFFSYSMQHAKGAKMPRGSKDAILNYQIPIPCPSAPEKSLAIQSEIVRILDKFTALTAELTAELTMRKKQYNYYRDQLLSFEGGSVEWKSLGEVAIITIGAFVRKDKQNPDADYPVYNGGRTPTGYYEDFNNDGDKIIVSARGANAGFVNKSSTPYWAGNSCYSISVRSTDQLHWMYVYYYLKQSETKLTGIQQKGGIPAVSKKQMEDLLLPIPSKSEQVRIVTILDKFDTLTSSITEGLPREIELRQKQYEYYRDLLFSFPKPDAVSH
ncbi:TPA: restriction endonuclease subunit S [Klebsiella pneumoniae]|uniref:restriction endonuclease subunit S n=1 Tax=Klebsiella pneumoniae TaxID=573 RepID=UPI001E576EBA|nr:restriction endonuclease subunit S [Klebsiella pneumoniae]HDG7680431.1 restriction endonuclease subunit S [Klebsiella quasipneumoniae]MCD9355251.1 restriction endonuclease subunit S [Klebsiella pneumoniae]WEE66460.1 restriction endonuclease subunit S [Klebsiella pneumoniae]HBQ4928615.1 restriction endonuclease subunit S [Klebsiella pneumoniae]HBQ9266322.1 restriction endonuclease subunit S [Klebsiella pneumoniae]